jgi:hypothetical protein
MGGLGHIGIVLLLRNRAPGVCDLFGYPGVKLLGASGAGQDAKRTSSGYLGGISGSGLPIIHLAPGATASALMEGSDVPTGTGSCPIWTALLVTPPNETSTVRIAHAVGALCTPQIHPVVEGTSGSEQ